MTPWQRRPWLCIDVETTGLDPETDRIIQLATCRLTRETLDFEANDGVFTKKTVVLECHSWLVNPGMSIPYESNQIHGICDEDVEDKPAINSVEIRNQVFRQVGETDVLVAYHWPFDAAFMSRAYGQAWDIAIRGKTIIDPLVLLRAIDNKVGIKRSHSLEQMAKDYGVYDEIEDRDVHTAPVDARLALLVLDRVCHRLPLDDMNASWWIDEQRELQERELRRTVLSGEPSH